MAKKEHTNSESDQNKALEPEMVYKIGSKSKTITISSLEELNELDRKHTGNLSPARRMEYLRKLNENVYGLDLSRQEGVLWKGEIFIREQS